MAFSVPDSLVVTLERVLGNETIGISPHSTKFEACFVAMRLTLFFFVQLNC